MRRKTYLAVLGVAALVILAGCSAIFGSADEEAEFAVTIDDVEDTAVVGENHEVTVSVENVGEAEGETEVWYDVGMENYTDTVTLDTGESTTVTFTHAFDETGTHDATVNGDSVTVTVITLLEAAEQTMAETSSMTAEGEQVAEGIMTFETDGETRNEALLNEESFEVTYDFEAEAMHQHEVITGHLGDLSQERTIDRWYLDGLRYVVDECDCTGERDTWHDVSEVAFDDADYLDVEQVLDGLTEAQRQDTGDSYVYTISDDDADAMEAFLDATEEEAPFRNIDDDTRVSSFTVSVTIDRDTHHVTAIESEMTIAESGNLAFTGDVEFAVEYDDFDAPANIAGAEEVREEVAPDPQVQVVQDGGAVGVEAQRLDGTTLRIEVNGEPVDTLALTDEPVILTDVDVGDEVVVIAEPLMDEVFEEEEIARHTVEGEG